MPTAAETPAALPEILPPPVHLLAAPVIIEVKLPGPLDTSPLATSQWLHD